MTLCPWCNSADKVARPSLFGPHICDTCQAVELKRDLPGLQATPEELEKGWFMPPAIRQQKAALRIGYGQIILQNDKRDIIVLVDTGTELVEVIREINVLNYKERTIDHAVYPLGIEDAIEQRGEFEQSGTGRKQVRVKYK